MSAEEGIGLLDLVKDAAKNTAALTEGELRMYNENKKLIWKIQKEVLKENNCTQEAGLAVKGIRQEIKNQNSNK